MFHETKRWIRIQLDQDTGSFLNRTTRLLPMSTRYAWYISRRIHTSQTLLWKPALPSTLWSWQDITRLYMLIWIHHVIRFKFWIEIIFCWLRLRSPKLFPTWLPNLTIGIGACFYGRDWDDLMLSGLNLQPPVAVSYELPWWCHDIEIISILVILLIIVTGGGGGGGVIAKGQ